MQPSMKDINMMATSRSNQMAEYGDEAMNPPNQMAGFGVDNMLESLGSPTHDFGPNPTWLNSSRP
ncbi:hypothetical protein Ancab_000502 [Ancistrocladus abbreviatus]